MFAQNQLIQGFTMVAPPYPIQIDSYQEVVDAGVNYVSIIPYGYCRVGETEIWYNSDRQWWGERLDGARQMIKMAHKSGLSVMLKPQIYVPSSWPGDINFDSDKEWKKWEASYLIFIRDMVKMAVEEEVDILCIGTEFKESAKNRPAFWIKMIEEIRQTYCGQLTYSANWDHYQQIPFWKELDFVGVSAYFPLSEEKTPVKKDLVKKWSNPSTNLASFSSKINRPILFTEYGYLSVDGAAGKTWLLEKKVRNLKINEEAQARSLDALYEVFFDQKYWAGGFLWKYFPNNQGHEGYFKRDYTPQGKKSMAVIKRWFKR